MTIKDILESMDYGKAPENAEEATSWLDRHQCKFGHFIDGVFCKGSTHFESFNPATNEILAMVSQNQQLNEVKWSCRTQKDLANLRARLYLEIN